MPDDGYGDGEEDGRGFKTLVDAPVADTRQVTRAKCVWLKLCLSAPMYVSVFSFPGEGGGVATVCPAPVRDLWWASVRDLLLWR